MWRLDLRRLPWIHRAGTRAKRCDCCIAPASRRPVVYRWVWDEPDPTKLTLAAISVMWRIRPFLQRPSIIVAGLLGLLTQQRRAGHVEIQVVTYEEFTCVGRGDKTSIREIDARPWHILLSTNEETESMSNQQAPPQPAKPPEGQIGGKAYLWVIGAVVLLIIGIVIVKNRSGDDTEVLPSGETTTTTTDDTGTGTTETPATDAGTTPATGTPAYTAPATTTPGTTTTPAETTPAVTTPAVATPAETTPTPVTPTETTPAPATTPAQPVTTPDNTTPSTEPTTEEPVITLPDNPTPITPPTENPTGPSG